MHHLTAYEQQGLDGIAQFQPSARALHDELGLSWHDTLLPLLDQPIELLVELVQKDPLLALHRELIEYSQAHLFSNLKAVDRSLFSRVNRYFLLDEVTAMRHDDSKTQFLLEQLDAFGLDHLPALLPKYALRLAQAREWIVTHQDSIEQARARCIARRMLDAISSPNLLRARTTINKTLFALITEYRVLKIHQSAAALVKIKVEEISQGDLSKTD